MIQDWHYYEEQVDDVRRQLWVCRTFDSILGSKIDKWFEDQGVIEDKDYNCHFRYNSGFPAHYISIHKEELATLFYLTFVEK